MVAAVTLQDQDGVKYVVVPPRLAAVAARRPDGDFRMLTAAQALVAAPPDAVALIDSSMFRAVGAQNRGESDTDYYRRVDRGMTNFRLLDAARGIDVPSRRPRDGFTLSLLPDGAAVVNSGDAAASGATFAVQLYPPLVRRGAVVASNVGGNAQQNWRAGVGVRRDGQLVFAVGRKDMVAFARAGLGMGLVDFGYTDGGGSGYEVIAGGAHYGSSENRPVPVWLAALPLPAGTSPRPYGGAPAASGSGGGVVGKIVAALAALAAAAGVGYAVERSRR